MAERLSDRMAVYGWSRHGSAWVDVTAEVSVSPEALYRDLARRRNGGAPDAQIR